MLDVTDNAVAAIRRVMAGAGPDVTGLRVMVIAGGCSGFKYKVGFDTTTDHGDHVLEFDGFRVFIDRDSGRRLEGARMDYIEKIDGSGFVFDNPKAARSCECGKSFSC